MRALKRNLATDGELTDIAKKARALEAVKRMDALFDIDRAINGLSAERRGFKRFSGRSIKLTGCGLQSTVSAQILCLGLSLIRGSPMFALLVCATSALISAFVFSLWPDRSEPANGASSSREPLSAD